MGWKLRTTASKKIFNNTYPNFPWSGLQKGTKGMTNFMVTGFLVPVLDCT